MEHGCAWEGTVGTWKDHVPDCGFSLVTCPNKCSAKGVELQVMKKSLDVHLSRCPNRPYSCDLCGHDGTYISIRTAHDLVCSKKIISCTNSDCSVELERGKLNAHLRTDCEYEIVPCKYDSLGCCVKKMRQDIKRHHEEEDGKSHLSLALEAINELKVKKYVVKDGEPMTFKVSGFFMSRITGKIHEATPYYVTQGYKVSTYVHLNGRGVYVGEFLSVLVYLEKAQDNDDCEWPFYGVVRVELLNQLSDSNHHQKEAHFFMPGRHSNEVVAEFDQFIPRNLLSLLLLYLCNNLMYFRVTVINRYAKPWLQINTFH